MWIDVNKTVQSIDHRLYEYHWSIVTVITHRSFGNWLPMFYTQVKMCALFFSKCLKELMRFILTR